MVNLVHLGLIGLLALTECALASPQGFGKSFTNPSPTTLVPSTVPKFTGTGSAPAATGLTPISDSDVDQAPIVDLPPTNPSLKPIPGAPLADVLAARPDIQNKIDQQPTVEQSILSNTTSTKRDIARRGVLPVAPLSDPGTECIDNGGPKFDVSVWLAATKKLCNHWFLDHSLVTYIPSGTGFASTFAIGKGGGITLTFQYGVTDLGSGFIFYEPFSYDICVADLTGLIADMSDQCLTEDGVDMGFVPLGLADVAPFAPSLKFYGFHD